MAKIDWCSSNMLQVEVKEGAIYELEVGSNLTGWRILLVMIYITVLCSDYLYLRLAGP